MRRSPAIERSLKVYLIGTHFQSMRELIPVFGLCVLAGCEPKIYIDEPLDEPADASTGSPDAGAPDTGAPQMSGPAPNLSCTPEALYFGTVQVGSTQTQVVLCSNTGDAALLIAGIQLELAHPAFTFATDPG